MYIQKNASVIQSQESKASALVDKSSHGDYLQRKASLVNASNGFRTVQRTPGIGDEILTVNEAFRADYRPKEEIARTGFAPGAHTRTYMKSLTTFLDSTKEDSVQSQTAATKMIGRESFGIGPVYSPSDEFRFFRDDLVNSTTKIDESNGKKRILLNYVCAGFNASGAGGYEYKIVLNKTFKKTNGNACIGLYQELEADGKEKAGGIQFLAAGNGGIFTEIDFLTAIPPECICYWSDTSGKQLLSGGAGMWEPVV